MARRARERAPAARILCQDITHPGFAAEERYDVITAFRFFLNAEPELRIAGFRALATRLRDRSSLLIFNNHGNLVSYKLATGPAKRIRHHGHQRQSGNYLSHRTITRLAEASGLRIIAVRGCGLIPARVAARLPTEIMLRLERRMARGHFARFGVNQMYVARLG